MDTLLVGGDPSFDEIDPAVAAWLSRRAPTVRRYGSVCTGVFFLAAAGLVDGRRVTTHWECADKLRHDFPNLIVDENQIFMRDGALCTTAGVRAGMDLALALVEGDFGREPALIVARYMVMFLKRPCGQSQFSAHLAAQMSTKSQSQVAQEYVLENLSKDLSVDALALRAGMSTRNFSRVFRRELKYTPAAFVDAARIDAARRMLADTKTPPQRVARACGFGTVNSMRRVFVRNLRGSPHDYRKSFRTACSAMSLPPNPHRPPNPR